MKINKINESFGSLFNYDDSYKANVRRELSDIIATEYGISEKSFQAYDRAIEIAKIIIEDEAEVINEYENRKSRNQLCAEIIFEKHLDNIKEKIETKIIK